MPLSSTSFLVDFRRKRDLLMGTDLIDELQAVIDSFWARTKLGDSIRVERSRRDFGYPHVEVVKGKFDIVITERGQEIQRLPRLSMTEAARWYLLQMALEHTSKLELSLRTTPEDAPPLPYGLVDDGYSRWNWMAPTIEIMHLISPEFGKWTSDDFQNTLLRSPLEDYEKRNSRYPLLSDEPSKDSEDRSDV